jgi:hypothetical protein
VHLAVLNQASMHYRLGNLDEALTSVMESIKISQNKNDKESILECLLWLYQIIGELGNKEQVREAFYILVKITFGTCDDIVISSISNNLCSLQSQLCIARIPTQTI